ncbi:MAG: carbon-nitrogen hydrolase family protein [Candidatus Brocadiia bacterium]
MSDLKVALLQMAACDNDQDANLEKGEQYCRRAADAGAHVALFPEMWNVGYSCGFDDDADDPRPAWEAQAVGRDSTFVTRFRELARELGMAVALTYLEKWDGPPRNTVSLIDRAGEIVLTYAKVHTCDFFPMESCCTPGDGFHVAELDTAAGPVQVGAMICYDREHPESARVLMLKGAELILTPNACGLQSLRLTQFRSRAFENSVGVAMTNYPSSHPYANGQSVAYDTKGDLLVQAGKGEGLFMATFDLDAMREHRAKTVWGNAFRRPHRYGLLTSMEVKEPFVRKNGLEEPFERARR